MRKAFTKSEQGAVADAAAKAGLGSGKTYEATKREVENGHPTRRLNFSSVTLLQPYGRLPCAFPP